MKQAIAPGQVRRFKNYNYDVKYVVLTYQRYKPCLLMLLDAVDDVEAGQLVTYDWDMQIIGNSTECEL